jgi:secretion/DNA translocation related TadE-like protein
VAVLGAVGAVLVVFLGGSVVASATLASHRARAAADLAALAAASAISQGAGPAGACGRAAQIADRNGGRLTVCAPSADGSVEVSAEAPWSGPWPVRPPAKARARAGPAG